MRVANWNPVKTDARIIHASMDRLEKVGELIAAEARARVPVGQDVKAGSGKWSGRKAGALRETIRVTRLKDDARRNIRIYAGNREVYYARFVERGTVKMQARRFLMKALNACKARAKMILLNGV